MHMIPNLKEHILFTDITTPATYKRYIGSPTGSQYDMLPVPSNFGKNRLPTRTPIKGLFLPKFSHGIWPCLQAGLQVVDMISGGKIMQGNSSLSKHEVWPKKITLIFSNSYKNSDFEQDIKLLVDRPLVKDLSI